MPKELMKIAGVGICLCFVAGCTGAVGVSARSYFADEKRVDQDMSQDGNNFGYVYGTPKPEDRSDFKKTRKVYVVEFTKEAEDKDGDDVIVLPARERPVPPPPAERRRPKPEPEADQLVIPDFDEMVIEEEPVSAGGYENYTVQKNDTLQKISKKYYNTYRRWQEIYDANQDVMSDPNKLKVGMTLRIPVEK